MWSFLEYWNWAKKQVLWNTWTTYQDTFTEEAKKNLWERTWLDPEKFDINAFDKNGAGMYIKPQYKSNQNKKETPQFVIPSAPIQPQDTSSNTMTGGGMTMSGEFPKEKVPTPKEVELKNTIDKSILDERKSRFFNDEARAYQKMIDDWVPESQAVDMVYQRRQDLQKTLGFSWKITPKQLEAVDKMKKDGIPSKEAFYQLVKRQKDMTDKEKSDFEKKYEEWSIAQKALYNTLMFGAGNLQTILEYGGNTLDFITGGQAWFWDEVKKMKEVTENSPEFDSSAFKAGTYLPDVAMSVAPVWWVASAGAKWTMSALKQWWKIGAIFGGTNPIINEWSEASIWDVAESAVLWWVVGWVLNAGVQKATTAIGSMIKNRAINKAIEKSIINPDTKLVPWMTDDWVELIIPQSTSLLEKSKSWINKMLDTPWEKTVVPDSSGVSQRVRWANRAIMPPSTGKSAKAITTQATKKVEDSLKTLWQLVRSGKVEWNLDSMADATQTMIKALDHYGNIIGKAIEKNGDELINTANIADDLANFIETAPNLAKRGEAYKSLELLLSDVENGMISLSRAQVLKQEAGATLAQLYRAGEGNSVAYQSLKKALDTLLGKIDDKLLTSGTNLDEVRMAREIYRKLKTIELPLAKSMQVDLRRPDVSLFEQMAIANNLDPSDWLINPVWSLKDKAIRETGKFFAERNSRNWAFQKLIRSYDSEAVSKYWIKVQP